MYLYPKWIRVWHLVNAVMILILIVTGISMQYTDKENAAYVVGFAKAVKWHNFAAVIMVINYIVLCNREPFNKEWQLLQNWPKEFFIKSGEAVFLLFERDVQR